MDSYDKQIEELILGHSGMLLTAWSNGEGIFQFVTPDGKPQDRPDYGRRYSECGDLTRIRADKHNHFTAWTDSLASRIAHDDALPTSIEDLCERWPLMPIERRRMVLAVLAEWQRVIDKEIRNVAA